MATGYKTLLQFFRNHPENFYKTEEVVKHTGLNINTARRYLTRLRKHGYIEPYYHRLWKWKT